MVPSVPSSREHPNISWMWERCCSEGGWHRGEQLFSLRRAKQQFISTLESLQHVWKLLSWNSFRRDPSLPAYSFLYFPFLSTDWRETGRTNQPLFTKHSLKSKREINCWGLNDGLEAAFYFILCPCNFPLCFTGCDFTKNSQRKKIKLKTSCSKPSFPCWKSIIAQDFQGETPMLWHEASSPTSTCFVLYSRESEILTIKLFISREFWVSRHCWFFWPELPVEESDFSSCSMCCSAWPTTNTIIPWNKMIAFGRNCKVAELDSGHFKGYFTMPELRKMEVIYFLLVMFLSGPAIYQKC